MIPIAGPSDSADQAARRSTARSGRGSAGSTRGYPPGPSPPRDRRSTRSASRLAAPGAAPREANAPSPIAGICGTAPHADARQRRRRPWGCGGREVGRPVAPVSASRITRDLLVLQCLEAGVCREHIPAIRFKLREIGAQRIGDIRVRDELREQRAEQPELGRRGRRPVDQRRRSSRAYSAATPACEAARSPDGAEQQRRRRVQGLRNSRLDGEYGPYCAARR